MEGNVAIITGAGRGIGEATAEKLARQGVKVVLTDIDQERVETVRSKIVELGGEAIAFSGDVTENEFPSMLVAEAVYSFGRLDVLVNNAGYTWDGLVHKMTDEQFRKIMEVHLVAPFRLIREAAPYMRDAAKKEIEQGINHYRKIINVSSIAGLTGNVGQTNYASAKAGLFGLTKSVAKEWGQFNINCNAIAFGVMDTRLTQPKEQGESISGIPLGIPKNVREQLTRAIPQKRPGTIEEAADAIYYLTSPMSNYVNGAVLQVNGGIYM
ncbi:SDR family oxidoreductase [Neobacillus sp. PS2-9]|uniref:SDR family NAD(P)-dependent oxidoreductase n=1 Tax=Neobacillus sp. PS2-9 TaxID=3070676 RepID=UPI0027E04472|nr:SDR family oxidoreductase [Neobacillus sp. PS2-9]WML57102.1 SDR family oxidoreductase [Neobacillus sp. PS2-9]